MVEIKKYDIDFFSPYNSFVVSCNYNKSKDLNINLVNANNNCQINCLFKETLSFCEIDEGQLLDIPIGSSMTIGLYQLEGKQYLEYYHGQSYMFCMKDNINHHLLVTDNEVFSILSYRKPIISISQA